ncbi:MAG TPA: RluA family pseudouridine synthase [Candidatus Acidoferrales bacterium]|nr:RluA family pseudouridine synthase [Candidatus Acidoferrales bacterium]
MSVQYFRVSPEEAGSRLDLYLGRRVRDSALGEGLSRSALQRMIEAGEIRLNGARAKPSARVRAGDCVELEVKPARASALEAERLPLDILHEDADCIVINKAPGIVVHPGAGNASGTLVNALLFHCAELRGIGGEKRPGIVHRLDKNTSGLMVVAKHDEAYHRLAAQFKERSVQKEYVALVWGKPHGRHGVIDRPIGRHRLERKKMASRNIRTRARAALTEWRLEEVFEVGGSGGAPLLASLLRVVPRTGRTHQIRVHLADEGLPIVGDATYGLKRGALDALKRRGLEPPALADFARQALHAERLRFAHPRTGAVMAFAAPLFPDMQALLDRLRERKAIRRREAREGIDKGIAFS